MTSKIKLVLTFLLFNVCVCKAQSNLEIGNIYLTRAETSYYSNNIDQAVEFFKKAKKHIGETIDSHTAKVGMLINYKIEDYQKAKIFAKQYFLLEIDKGTDDYIQMLEIYVNIEESIEDEFIKAEQIRKEKIAEQIRNQKIDSLTKIWHKKEEALTLKVDTIGTFNSYGIALYRVNKKYGLIDDKGTIIVKSDFKNYLSFDGYTLLIDDKYKPVKILCFNNKNKKVNLLPDVSNFNLPSTHYGTVMFPRGNDYLVTYPDNSSNVFVYNMNTNEVVKKSINIEYLKKLKDSKFIDKYNKELQIKYKGEWYNLGTTLGGGIYPLFSDANILQGYFLSSNGTFLEKNKYGYIGAFYNRKAQVINKDDLFWIDQNANVKDDENEDAKYSGTSKVVKLNDNKYQIIIKNNDIETIIFDGKSLQTKEDFINEIIQSR